MGAPTQDMEERDRNHMTDDTYVCEGCSTGYTSEAAAERCDCGADDYLYSPSWRRVSYVPGED